MIKILAFICIFFIFSCSGNKGVYWCGDHPCINKKEKEAYFKKTMIVEVKTLDKESIKNESELEELLKQAKKDEKKRIYNEKELKKLARIEEKRRIKEEKELEKKIIKEEKELEKRRIKEEKKLKKRRVKKESELAKKSESKNIKKKNNEKQNVFINNDSINRKTTKFIELKDNIIERNSIRPYPEINDIPN